MCDGHVPSQNTDSYCDVLTCAQYATEAGLYCNEHQVVKAEHPDKQLPDVAFSTHKAIPTKPSTQKPVVPIFCAQDDMKWSTAQTVLVYSPPKTCKTFFLANVYASWRNTHPQGLTLLFAADKSEQKRYNVPRLFTYNNNASAFETALAQLKAGQLKAQQRASAKASHKRAACVIIESGMSASLLLASPIFQDIWYNARHLDITCLVAVQEIYVGDVLNTTETYLKAQAARRLVRQICHQSDWIAAKQFSFCKGRFWWERDICAATTQLENSDIFVAHVGTGRLHVSVSM